MRKAFSSLAILNNAFRIERERKREWRSAKALRVVADVLVEWEKSRIFHTMSMILHFIFLPQGKISGKILDDILLLNDDDNEKKK